MQIRYFLLFITFVVSGFANINVVCKAGIMDNQSAKRYINKLLKNEPDNIECILKLADVYLKSGELMRGYQQVVKAYNINPHSVKNSSVANVLPDALKMTSLYERAKRTDDVKLWNNIAGIFFDMGVAKEASKAYKKSLQINQTQSEVALKLALSYKRIGKTALALEVLEKLLVYHPDNFYGHYYLAKLLAYEYNEIAKARVHFKKSKNLLEEKKSAFSKQERLRFLYDLDQEMKRVE